MASLNLKSLVSKLNPLCRQSLEGAAGLCLSRTNHNVEIEHWLTKITERTDGDFEAIVKEYDLNMSRLLADLQKTLDRFKTGNGRPPALGQHIVDLIRDAWLIASVEFGESSIRSGFMIMALVGSETLSRVASACSAELDKISYESLKKSLYDICQDSSENASVSTSGASADGAGGKRTGPTKTPSLDQFTIDLTDRARRGEIDPVLGRDDEIRQVIDILCRRRQNNPILTGEPGVGKTAVAEGFALRIAEGDVPPALQNVTLRVLDLALLQAGAGVKGEFENRLKSVIEEVKSSATPIILFIDEAHTLIGAGGQAGQGDAANLIKPALARGELRTIAATTWAEYKKYFERDAALARRFQVVNVLEPSESSAIDMLRGLVATLETHHKVRILSEAVEDAVKLSNRYISGRQLPDKAISLLDTTCARIGLSQNSTPPAIEACVRKLQQLATTIGILERENEAGADHGARIDELRSEEQRVAAEKETLEARWQTELNLVSRINERRAALNETLKSASSPESPAAQPENSAKKPADTAETAGEVAPEISKLSREELKADIAKLEEELSALQGDEPLVFACCDSGSVAATVAAWTGIPVGRMVSNEIRTILNLKDRMEEQVVGQTHALSQIAESIQTSRAKLTDPSRPIGVFLLAGTSGVGKTETALTLAELLYGGEQNVTVINMSEFKEEHKVSLLMGSPPGYVGYGEGGVLTEAVRRKPYSVLLLDEMEKAHPGVQDVFYQVFDKGHMKDGEGRDIDFKNTVIIMTSNAGTDLIKSLCADPDTMPSPTALAETLHPELLKTFKPAFLGRVTVIPYFPLADEIMRRIIRLKLGKVVRRVTENYGARMEYTDKVVDTIASRCTEVDTGARNVDKILNKTLLPELSSEFLTSMADGVEFKSVLIDADENGFQYTLQP
ncbi:MAG: type VI secretion system ATPase TssH [Planctomycetales bacterium]|nr:type VI secretion system ATPase TssH [Planctomycetales bacterium]